MPENNKTKNKRLIAQFKHCSTSPRVSLEDKDREWSVVQTDSLEVGDSRIFC